MTTTSGIDSPTIAEFVRRAADIERELRKVIVGQHDAVRQVLIALFAGGACVILFYNEQGLGSILPALWAVDSAEAWFDAAETRRINQLRPRETWEGGESFL